MQLINNPVFAIHQVFALSILRSGESGPLNMLRKECLKSVPQVRKDKAHKSKKKSSAGQVLLETHWDKQRSHRAICVVDEKEIYPVPPS